VAIALYPFLGEQAGAATDADGWLTVRPIPDAAVQFDWFLRLGREKTSQFRLDPGDEVEAAFPAR